MSSVLDPLQCDVADSMADVFINPQYTDKRYCDMQSTMCITPEPSPTDGPHRRASFAFSDTTSRSTYFHRGSSSSAGSSSLMSASACATPSLLTPSSSASNSRRQSMLLPDSSQQYCFSTGVSSPTDVSQGPNGIASFDQYPLTDYSAGPYTDTTDTTSLMTDGLPTYIPEYSDMADERFIENGPTQYFDSQMITSSYTYRAVHQALQDDESTSPRHSSVALTNMLLDQHPQPSISENELSLSSVPAYGNHDPSVPHIPLQEPFQYRERKYEPDDSIANEAMSMSDVARARFHHRFDTISDGMSQQYSAFPPKKKSKSSMRGPRVTVERGDPLLRPKDHQCSECDYACNRHEHLKRHETSVHCKAFDGGPEMLPCVFEGCIDRKTKKRKEIQTRRDNLKAHYTKTHFKYGNTEKGGKNSRKSMKAAHEMGLGQYDLRWEFLLEDKMKVNEEMKDYLHVWKMLGYSILETQNIKVKDVVPDWDPKNEPPDSTLQKFDPRWKALWDGSLTFDKAMSVGHDMEESEAQGLLGVTMLETEAMGIDHLDPRWGMLRNGGMSVEMSEKLGIKYRNPVWTDSAASTSTSTSGRRGRSGKL